MIGFDYKKAVQVLNFFALKEGGSINKMKALKLIWFSDRAHLRKYGRPILSDRYYAMKLGPVPSSTKDLTNESDPFSAPQEIDYRNEFLSAKTKRILKSNKQIDEDFFSETDLEILENIYKEFGKYDKFKLAELSHDYPEWERFEKAIKAKQSFRFEMNYLDFFKNPEQNKQDFFSVADDDLELSRSIFEENQAMII